MEKKKHQRQSISLDTKIAILDRLGKGEESTAIGKHFNLGESTVRAIKKNEAAIRKSVISGTKLSTKFASYTRDVLLERTERTIAIWIEEQVQRRIPIWPACVTDNTTTQTSTLSDEIINLAHEIGRDGFNTFSHDDIDELLVDDALSDNDIIDLTLDLTVDGVVGLEGDNDEEEKLTPLTGKLIQEVLQLCSKLQNSFLINHPNSERASKLQRELQNCMSGYRELYKKIKESSSQSLITDNIVRKGRATQNENEVCENPWPLPQISIAETVSSDDEGDLEPLRKRCKPLSDSDND
ncbi:uncharacterized protein TNCV_4744001 [Trichonephila clavipes]|nr:uncharacterized protein TNCV_4744001 [Trichonephila clavipes]